jgi:hypothetical protein
LEERKEKKGWKRSLRRWSCLLAARAQLAEGQRAASSVVYRAASAAAAVAAVATIVAHSCCDVPDSYIVNALRDDSSEDDTWRFALDNDGDAYYDQNGW